MANTELPSSWVNIPELMAFCAKLTAAIPDMWSSSNAATVGAPTALDFAVGPDEGATRNGFAANA